MKKLVWLALAMVVLHGLLLLCACGSGEGDGGTAGSLVGVWAIVESTDDGGVGYTVTFRADGTGIWMVVPMTYTYNGKDLAVTTTTSGTVNMTVKWRSDGMIEISGDGFKMILVKM